MRDRRGPVLVARLNRPDARNALTPEVIRGIGAAIVEAEGDPEIRAVVLTGTGDRAFCAGMDLRAFAAGEQTGLSDDEAGRGFTRLIEGDATVPVVGAANGTAVAGGFELLLGCDVIVASSAGRVRAARGEARAVPRRRRHVSRHEGRRSASRWR